MPSFFVISLVLGAAGSAHPAPAAAGFPLPPSAAPHVADLVRVPGGTFVMGDGEALCGWQEREVTLTRGFWIGRTEVTNADYRDRLQWAWDNGLVAADPQGVWTHRGDLLVDLDDDDSELVFDGDVFTIRQSPYALAHAYPDGYDATHHPVKEISWYGAATYCNWRSRQETLPAAYDEDTWSCGPGGDPYGAQGYRLPTDAEWEFVARAYDDRSYPWGEADPDCDRANYVIDITNYCVQWTLPAGSLPRGAQQALARDIFDLAGNVYEWVHDGYTCNLGRTPVTDPVGDPASPDRVIRGGGWYSTERYVRSAARNLDPLEPDPFTAGDVGLRVVRTAHRPSRHPRTRPHPHRR